jgi:thiol-disulfide isomerase/thioredoxin
MTSTRPHSRNNFRTAGPASAARALAFTFALAVALATGSATAKSEHAAEPRTFTSRSFPEIRAAHQGEPLVVAFWSVNCEPCKREMTALTRLHRAFPKVKIVVVAADPPELRPAVLRFLGRYELGRIEPWQFADEPDERLRYSVDHGWRGELPRSYFIDATGEVTTQSGVPEGKWADEWFQRASGATRPPAT